MITLQRRHNEHDGFSNHQHHDCLLNRSFKRRSKKTSKLRVTGFCEGNSPVTGELPEQRASNAENVSIWWRHHEIKLERACMSVSPERTFRLCSKRFCVQTGCLIALDNKAKYLFIEYNRVWLRSEELLVYTTWLMAQLMTKPTSENFYWYTMKHTVEWIGLYSDVY